MSLVIEAVGDPIIVSITMPSRAVRPPRAGISRQIGEDVAMHCRVRNLAKLYAYLTAVYLLLLLTARASRFSFTIRGTRRSGIRCAFRQDLR